MGDLSFAQQLGEACSDTTNSVLRFAEVCAIDDFWLVDMESASLSQPGLHSRNTPSCHSGE